jgi:insulysin
MGTDKYPEENDYSKFISDSGGNDNAFTTLECTNYHFDVSNDAFEKALDMFAQFFICPLFNQNSVEKEMKAVDSEFRNSLQSDPDRYFQIFQNESNPESAFNRFITGSLETLQKEGIVEELKKFHERWYSSNIMKL